MTSCVCRRVLQLRRWCNARHVGTTSTAAASATAAATTATAAKRSPDEPAAAKHGPATAAARTAAQLSTVSAVLRLQRRSLLDG